MESHLALLGWRLVKWEAGGGGDFGLTLNVFTHKEHGAWFHPGTANALQVHYGALRHIESCPELPWGAEGMSELRAVVTKLQELGLC